MDALETFRVGYVVKRYPRYSETFIVNEILAHEAAGLGVEIFAMRPTIDTHFQDRISRVRASVEYLPYGAPKASAFWANLNEVAQRLPDFWNRLSMAADEPVDEVHQAIVLAIRVIKKRINHLHAHFASGAAAVARLAALFAEVPYSFTAHAKDIFHESVSSRDLLRKMEDASCVVTVSDFNVDFLRNEYSPRLTQGASKVKRVYNGLDLAEFPFSSPRNRPKNVRPTIIAVGRLIAKKGFSDLIEACALLDSRGRDFTCDIIGQGELEEGLRQQIDKLRLHDRVRLVGPMPQADVIEHLRNASVMAAPCVVGEDGNRDGLPTVLLEAMALGTPCVSTDVTGIPEVLRHQETGIMVPQHRADALAEAIQHLLEDEDERALLADKARRLIESEFDVHRNAARLREVFFAAVKERGGEKTKPASPEKVLC